MNKRTIMVTTAATALAALSMTAGAAEAETLRLDTTASTDGKIAGPVATTSPLTSGARYVVTVQGTLSIWEPGQWSRPGGICGAEEAAPQFPFPGKLNGPVGADAETGFAVAPGIRYGGGFDCTSAEIPYHVLQYSSGGFQIDSGSGFGHVEPTGGPFTVPRADHLYTYAITGRGKPAAFRFSDSQTADNYGQFEIKVEPKPTDPGNPNNPKDPENPKNPGLTGAGGQNGSGEVLGTERTSSALSLPSARKCISRRSFRIRLRKRKGIRFSRANVFVNGKQVRTLRGKRVTAPVNLRGLPAGKVTVRIVAVTSRGQRITAQRVYRTCTRACTSRRNFKVRLKGERSTVLRRVVVTVKGRKAKTYRGTRRTVPIDLRGLRPGSVTVRIVATTTSGRVIRERRAYRTCRRSPIAL